MSSQTFSADVITDDPSGFPAKNRGLYFAQGDAEVRVSNIVLHIDFCIHMWVFLFSEENNLVTKESHNTYMFSLI